MARCGSRGRQPADEGRMRRWRQGWRAGRLRRSGRGGGGRPAWRPPGDGRLQGRSGLPCLQCAQHAGAAGPGGKGRAHGGEARAQPGTCGGAHHAVVMACMLLTVMVNGLWPVLAADRGHGIALERGGGGECGLGQQADKRGQDEEDCHRMGEPAALLSQPWQDPAAHLTTKPGCGPQVQRDWRRRVVRLSRRRLRPAPAAAARVRPRCLPAPAACPGAGPRR